MELVREQNVGVGPGWSDTLDRFVNASQSCAAVDLASLGAGVVVNVKTNHSQYRMRVLDGPRHCVSIQGGKFFEQATDATIEGAISGGSVLACGRIIVGLRLELSVNRGRIVTSSVRSFEIEDDRSDADHRSSITREP